MLSEVETECLELLDDLNDYLTRQVKPREFMTIMGRIRNLRVALTNKKFGCPSGRHSSSLYCKCKT